jgi:hypothetical protein
VPTTPEQRLQRLLRHARAGWERARNNPAARERARHWLLAHPSALPEVDQLWLDCLDERGPLHAWFVRGATADDWSHDQALHSVLAGHPFTDLPQWTELQK